MGVVDVEVQQPGFLARLPDEFDCPFGCPSRLVEFGGNAVLAFAKPVEVSAPLPHPVGVVVPFLPVVPGSMTELPIAKPVFDSRFGPLPRALQMKLSDHSAIIAGIGDQFGDHGWPFRKTFVPIPGVVNAAGIKAAHEACPAGRADGTLAIGMGKGRARADEIVQSGRSRMRVPQSSDGVKALLVGAVPKNIRSIGHLHQGVFFRGDFADPFFFQTSRLTAVINKAREMGRVTKGK